jgi:hypothetical protein
MRLVAAPIAAALLVSGCGGSTSTTERQLAPTRPVQAKPPAGAAFPAGAAKATGEQLMRLALALVPPAARRSLQPGALKPSECGIAPTFPCVTTFFTLPGGAPLRSRLSLLRAHATGQGWHVVRLRPFPTGEYLELRLGRFHARYGLERRVGHGAGITELDVVGPPTVAPSPSAAERDRWSAEKRRYVAAASAICVRTLGSVKNAHALSPALQTAARELASLPAPPGESRAARAVVRALRNFAAAARGLEHAKGEEALGAGIALADAAKRFDATARGYGLTKCAAP